MTSPAPTAMAPTVDTMARPKSAGRPARTPTSRPATESSDSAAGAASGEQPAGELLSPKGLATRTTIIDAALRLFSAEGYERTTMRAIASEAGVSLGNAYYYFASKEHLIQGFYDRAGSEHRALVAEMLADGPTGLDERLVGVIDLWIDAMEPYRSFAGAFFRSAADPTSPLSPFSPESAEPRDRTIALFGQVLDGSDVQLPDDLRATLPELLWLYFMGIVLFWVHDPTEGSARTHLLNRRISPLLVRATQLAGVPMARAAVDDLVALVADLKAM